MWHQPKALVSWYSNEGFCLIELTRRKWCINASSASKVSVLAAVSAASLMTSIALEALPRMILPLAPFISGLQNSSTFGLLKVPKGSLDTSVLVYIGSDDQMLLT
jgi:hypothetical protein